MPDSELHDSEQVRREVSSWLDTEWDPDLSTREWWVRLAQSGWGFPTWPKEWFGLGLDTQLAATVRDAFAAVGALGPPSSLGQLLGAPTLAIHATEEQKARFLPILARGEEMWCQFFSEPGAGSDLASAQTRAVRDGDEWVVNGQKVWTSGAQWSDRGMLVARTNPDAPKHRGLTFFIIDVDQPGIEVRPLHQMNDAHGFNEVFFTDARVANDRVIGDVHQGWATALTILAYERYMVAWGASPGRKLGLLERRAGDVVADSRGARGDSRVDPAGLALEAVRAAGKTDDPVFRQAIARTYAVSETMRFSGLRSAGTSAGSNRPSSAGSIRKLSRSVLGRETSQLGLEALGPAGLLVGDGAPLDGRVQQLALSMPSWSIAGGSDNIQHNIIGERILGLPKEPQVDRDIPFRDLKVGTQREPIR